MKRPIRFQAVAPAKVNLGLEILGRRPDGYHEIVTVMQAVSLFDLFEWTETGEPFQYRGPAAIPVEDDLVRRVLETAPDRDTWTGRLRLVKHIPIAAGLGGGSSDAALALRLAFPDASQDELTQRASWLGADVPFFLRGGTALATGTGTNLTRLPTQALWFVLVTPPVSAPQKTKTMYAGLREDDFSDGVTVSHIANQLRHEQLELERLPNGFARQLLQQHPMRYAYERLERAGGGHVSISGAGPTLYAVTGRYGGSAPIVRRLRRGVGDRVGRVEIARSVAERGNDPRPARIASAMRGDIVSRW